MVKYRSHKHWLIWFSFFIALLLQVMPWPNSMLILQPNWVLLILFCWIFVFPHYVNIGTSFVIGVILDLIKGTTIGTCALALIIISYFFVLKLHIFRNFTFWQQALIVMLLSLTADTIIFWVKFFMISVLFQPKVFLNSLVNGILWPWLSLLMHKICQQFIIR